MVEVTKLSHEEFKKAMKGQIDNIDIDDHVVLSVVFEKAPGVSHAEKHIELSIDKNVGVDEHEE